MSRKTLATKRGTAGLTAAAVAATALGALFVGTSSAAGPVITITGATVTNPVATKAVPTIPAAGPFDGSGTAVSIVGTNFPATPTVKFGSTDATSVLRISSSLIVAKAPSLTAGTEDDAVDVLVGDGTGADPSELSATVTAPDAYTYKAAPTLTDAKYSTDFKSLELTGTNLDDTRTLQLGPLSVKVKPAESTATTVKVKVPSALVKAKYAITAATDWGTATLSPDWNVRPAPSGIRSATGTVGVKSADSLNPDLFVRIVGKSLGSVDSVSFGGAAATFLVSSDSELFVQVPPMAATETVKTNVAKVSVVVKNGTLAAAKPLTFEYKVAPIVTAVDKTEAATGSVVTVTGQNLSGVKLYFGAAKGAKALSPKTGSTATSAQYVMPTKAATGFVLDTAYTLWFVSKGGNLETAHTLKVLGS